MLAQYIQKELDWPVIIINMIFYVTNWFGRLNVLLFKFIVLFFFLFFLMWRENPVAGVFMVEKYNSLYVTGTIIHHTREHFLTHSEFFLLSHSHCRKGQRMKTISFSTASSFAAFCHSLFPSRLMNPSFIISNKICQLSLLHYFPLPHPLRKMTLSR